MHQEYQRGGFLISTDKSVLDLEFIRKSLKKRYWADHISVDLIQMAVEHSVCFGVYYKSYQIGFARVVTNFMTIAYITDMFISGEYENAELNDWFRECIFGFRQLRHIKKWVLASKDGLYSRFKFTPLLFAGEVTPSAEVKVR